MKRHILPLLLVVIAGLSGCSSDELSGTSSGGNNAATFTVTVSDGGYAFAPDSASTRATENGYQTTFTVGDKIGVFAVKNGMIVEGVNNLCLTAEGSGSDIVWKNGGNAPLNIPGATYYAYYPYRSDLTDELRTDGITAKEFFANLIDNWSPATDQSTYNNYTAQDLMIAKGDLRGKGLSFSMQHQMALVVIELPKIRYTFDNKDRQIPDYIIAISNISFADFTPCSMDNGTYRYLVKPSDSNSLSGSYTNVSSSSRTWSLPYLPEAGNYKLFKIDGGTKEISHTLQVGDFYMKDGTLVGKDVTLSEAQQAACIGIVYSTDIARIGDRAKEALNDKGVASPHGLVMALTNASDDCRWGEHRDENGNTGGTGPFQSNTSTLQKQYNNVDGYGETHWILKNYSGADLRDTYSAFYHASRYGTAEGQTSQYAAPNTTTGWFIPSMGQWWDILSYLGGIDLTTYRGSGDDYAYISEAAQTAVDNMNNYLGKIGGTTMFSTGTYFWSSSEFSSSYACYVDFYSNGNLLLYSNAKGYSGSKVRCVFAF